MNRNYLFIFTNSYPYNQGEEFFAAELEYLQKFFAVELIPTSVPKIMANRDLNVKVNDHLLKKITPVNLALSFISNLVSRTFYKSLISEIRSVSNFGFHELKRCLSQLAKARITAELCEKIILNYKTNNVIFYNYWLDFPVLAFKFIDNPDVRLIARAHGIDLFADQNINGYVPLQLQKINQLSALFLVSDRALDYLVKRYGNSIRAKLYVAKLGITKLYHTNEFACTKNLLKIVSISSCEAIKRIHLIIDLLSLLKAAGVVLEWHHVGGGKLLDELKHYAKSKLGTGCIFYGYMANDEVQQILAKGGFSVFISCTASEGGNPVSMQEAQAYSLPIIATDVGGVPEVLEGFDCGWLLPRDFDLPAAAKMLAQDLVNQEVLQRKSANAYKSFLSKYQAEKNYTSFCYLLRAI